MAETAPRSPKVSGGLIFSRQTNTGSLAKALAVSLALHAVFLGATAIPQLVPSGRPAGELRHLVGELRPATDSTESRTADRPVIKTEKVQEKRLVDGAARPPSAASGAGSLSAPPVATDSSEHVALASLSAYRLAVAREARQFMAYPSTVRAAGVAAEVLVAMRTEPGLAEPYVQVLNSSGNRQLDEAARSMVMQAVRQAPLPSEWRGRRLQIEFPVLFAPDA